MLRLGDLELGAVPRVAVPVTDRVGADELAAARRGGMDAVELRLDLFSSTEYGFLDASLERFQGVPRIATLRLAGEGGQWKGPERERLALFGALAPRADALDVELAARETLPEVVALGREHGVLVIASHHDFRGTPPRDELLRIADAALEAGADIAKIATLPRGPADLRSLAALCVERPELPLIAIGMGEHGLVTRLLLPALGSLVAFAALDAASATAPGQTSLEEMHAWLCRLFPARAAEWDAGAGG